MPRALDRAPKTVPERLRVGPVFLRIFRAATLVGDLDCHALGILHGGVEEHLLARALIAPTLKNEEGQRQTDGAAQAGPNHEKGILRPDIGANSLQNRVCCKKIVQPMKNIQNGQREGK